ncbi:MAG TPA: hypothetical protein VEN81_13035, partial [Planctomycetota bacterium]|nr:hypothetical protein [Planctomycetota bacterium]
MSEELGRRLEKLYGGLDPSAGRLQALWRPRARPVAPPSSWRRIGAGSAAVAAGLLLGLWLRRPDPEPSRPRPELARPGGIRSPELSTAGGKGESFLRPPSPAQPAPAAPLPVSAAPEAPGP